jgi:hypothetical protein
MRVRAVWSLFSIVLLQTARWRNYTALLGAYSDNAPPPSFYRLAAIRRFNYNAAFPQTTRCPGARVSRFPLQRAFSPATLRVPFSLSAQGVLIERGRATASERRTTIYRITSPPSPAGSGVV